MYHIFQTDPLRLTLLSSKLWVQPFTSMLNKQLLIKTEASQKLMKLMKLDFP